MDRSKVKPLFNESAVAPGGPDSWDGQSTRPHRTSDAAQNIHWRAARPRILNERRVPPGGRMRDRRRSANEGWTRIGAAQKGRGGPVGRTDLRSDPVKQFNRLRVSSGEVRDSQWQVRIILCL
jgi:hypothetical protein